MTLCELIKYLEECNPSIVVPIGFNSPHSYRGDYAELAFEPATDVSVASMLACAREALGSAYEGFKGGNFRMGEHTDVYIAEYGCTGEGIGAVLLSYMMGQPSLGWESGLY